jgi:transposase InsO family protein
VWRHHLHLGAGGNGIAWPLSGSLRASSCGLGVVEQAGYLVIKALDMPYEQRGGPQGLLLHSDQWSQYGSRQFLQRLWRYVGALVLSRAVEKERTRKGIIASTRKAIEKSYFKPKK